jgi:hypothetical protein
MVLRITPTYKARRFRAEIPNVRQGVEPESCQCSFALGWYPNAASSSPPRLLVQYLNLEMAFWDFRAYLPERSAVRGCYPAALLQVFISRRVWRYQVFGWAALAFMSCIGDHWHCYALAISERVGRLLRWRNCRLYLAQLWFTRNTAVASSA